MSPLTQTLHTYYLQLTSLCHRFSFFSKAAPQAPTCYRSYITYGLQLTSAWIQTNPFKPNAFTTFFSSQPSRHRKELDQREMPLARSLSWDASGKMALCLALNSDPQQKKCRWAILQCTRCVILSIPCIKPNVFRLESKFTEGAVIAEDCISGLRFCVPSVPRHNRALSAGLSAPEVCLEVSMSFQEKLFTSLRCISNSNTSVLSHLYILIYTCYIHSHACWIFALPFSNIFQLDGVLNYITSLAHSSLHLPRYHVSFLLASEGLKESCKTGIWVNTVWRVLSMMPCVGWTQYFNLLNTS